MKLGQTIRRRPTPPAQQVAALEARLGCPVLARVYATRGMVADEIGYPTERLLPPDSLLGIDAATRLAARVLTGGGRLLVVADYDADGATGCALAVRGLRALGAAAVDYLVPSRFTTGYGLSLEVAEAALARRPDLVITVDNGIASLDGIASLRAAGVPVIVTDHHLPGERLPPANAIVNPRLPGDGFPSKHLAGVGVMFYLLLALRARLRADGWFGGRRPEPKLARLLDLVALGTVADVVPGVTLNLLKTSTTPVEVTVSADKKAVRDKIEAFQQAYNKINALLADLTRYDQGTKKAQPLQGDSTATGLQNALRGLLGRSDATGTYFTNVGLELQRDGSLSINATKLDAALNDLPKLEKTLTASTGNAATDGLVTRMRDFAFGANGVEGNITGRSKALEAAKKRNESDQDAMSLRLEQRQKNLLKQYQSLDAKLGSMSSLSSFMTSQVSQWNKS